MFGGEDQRSVLGRVPENPAGAASLLWPNAQGGMRRPGPLGSSADRWLSNRELHPAAPNNRFGPQAGVFMQRSFALTVGLLTSIFPRLGPAAAAAFVDPLNLYLQRYAIDSVCRMASFFGQIGVECAELTAMEENLRYTSVDRLRAIYPKKLAGLDVSALVANPKGLANVVYANRMGNGDVASEDGWRFRGRGLIHLTGRANYTALAAATGFDVVSEPDLLLQPVCAVLSACWFWQSNSLNVVADAGDIRRLTLKINGSETAYPARHQLTSRCLSHLRLARRSWAS